MADAPTEKEPPILVAAFSDEDHLMEAVQALEAMRVTRDFIGVQVAERLGGNGIEEYLLSVLLPKRRQDEAREMLVGKGAIDIGTPREFRKRYGLVPHPGAIEAQEMKLPFGAEYPGNLHRSRSVATQPVMAPAEGS